MTENASVEVEFLAEGAIPSQVLLKAAARESGIALLPIRFPEGEDAHFASSTHSVLKLLHEGGVNAWCVPEAPGNFSENRGLEWVGPTLLVSAALLSSDSNLFAIVTNILSSYLYDLFKGRESHVKVRLDILCFRGAGIHVKRVKYRGGVGGLKSLEKAVHRALEKDQDDCSPEP